MNRESERVGFEKSIGGGICTSGCPRYLPRVNYLRFRGWILVVGFGFWIRWSRKLLSAESAAEAAPYT